MGLEYNTPDRRGNDNDSDEERRREEDRESSSDSEGVIGAPTIRVTVRKNFVYDPDKATPPPPLIEELQKCKLLLKYLF